MSRTITIWVTGLAALCLLFLGVRCGITVVASDGLGSSYAASAISGVLGEQEGTLGSYRPTPDWRSILQQLFTPMVDAWAGSCLSVLTSIGCPSPITVNLSSCANSMATANWSGNLQINWTAGNCTLPVLSSTTATVVFTAGDPAAPLISTALSGAAVTLSTQDVSGYAVSKSGGVTLTCGATACSLTRTVAINGVHYVSGAGTGFDYTVSTDTPLLVSGTQATRVVASGVVRVQDNKKKYQSVSSVTTALGYSVGCCLPTSGTLSTTFVGGPWGGKSEIFSFTPQCGTAVLTNSSGVVSTVGLSRCY